MKNNIEKSWSNIDVMLKQRHDELIKLMNSVKGYMAHERGVLAQVTQARTSFLNAKTIPQKAQADTMMTSALKSIFAVAENYPNLKANENFIQFQNRISDIENQEIFQEIVKDIRSRFSQIIEEIETIIVFKELKEDFSVVLQHI